MRYDVAIVGGGIVGLATAYHLTDAYPDKSVVVLEKEDRVAAHQTGRNSGVIHSGVYYEPGSLRAENCREGKRALVAFCEEEGVDYEMCGKVIVAVDESEREGLHAIYERGQKNRIECELIGPDRLHEIEPHTKGVEAIRVPEAGIVDYTGVANRLAEIVRERGHEVKTGAGVHDVDDRGDHLVAETAAGSVEANYLINCAGLYADRVAMMTGETPPVQVVPFRGEYYELEPHARPLCRGLIYPVPEPDFPFLGVHFTKMVDGRVECGPSAVLAFAREGYRFTDIDWMEMIETLTYPGFLRLAFRHWRKGIWELAQSLSKDVYLQSLRHLIPEVQEDDLKPSPSGVRAMALTPQGEMVNDFLITDRDRVVNVLNAASPAATASLNIGRLVGERLAEQF